MPKQKKEDTAIKALKIPNYALSLFYVLLNVQLHGAQCRARNRIAQPIKNALGLLESERIRILEHYAEKDKDGKPKKKNENTPQEEYDLSPANLAIYQKEFDAMMHENYIFDLVPSIKADFALVRPLILESKIPLDTPQGYVYETLCKAVEEV